MVRGKIYNKKEFYKCLECGKEAEKDKLECKECEDKFVNKILNIKPYPSSYHIQKYKKTRTPYK